MNSTPTFTDITAQVAAAAAADPAIDAGVAQMWAECAAHAHLLGRNGLAALRQVAGLTQAELAARLGISQSAVAQAEGKGDLMASTVIRQIQQLGAEAIIRFEDGTEIDLVQLLAVNS